ncbi:Kynureninase [Nymphon striatum]|nr:Kynureninase [Nymphon striatum]
MNEEEGFTKKAMEDITPKQALLKKATENKLDITQVEFAKFMDENDELKDFKDKFVVPKNETMNVDLKFANGKADCLYFCGHSLGLRPKRTKEYIENIINDWDKIAVKMHFNGFQPAAFCEDYAKPLLAKLTGSKEDEITAMNSLTVNINLVSLSFYKPTEKRRKILIEHSSFPSDRFAMKSLLEFHGYDPNEDLIQIKPRDSEYCLRNEDILDLIETRGQEIAMIMFSGVQYYTGQLFDMKSITEVGHKQGCIVGFDLAHAIGNVSLNLHDWNVDFAAWCSYKYLSSGPGGLAGIFIHENRFDVKPALTGWWGNRLETKWLMLEDIELSRGADAFKISNCSSILTSMLQASLEELLFETQDQIDQYRLELTNSLQVFAVVDEDIDQANSQLIKTMKDAAKKANPTCNQSLNKFSATTLSLMNRRNDLIIRNSEDLLEKRDLNKTIHKRQRTETRAYNQRIVETTIKEGKGYKTAKKRLAIGNRQIASLKNADGEIVTDREEILRIGERFYQTLYTSSLNIHPTYSFSEDEEDPIPDITRIEVYDEAGMDRLLNKQFYLTGYLEFLLKYHFERMKLEKHEGSDFVQIITPEDHKSRGTQISLLFSKSAFKINEKLPERGVFIDFRQPNVLRIGPVPMYTSFESVHRLVTILTSVIEECKEDQ